MRDRSSNQSKALLEVKPRDSYSFLVVDTPLTIAFPLYLALTRAFALAPHLLFSLTRETASQNLVVN